MQATKLNSIEEVHTCLGIKDNDSNNVFKYRPSEAAADTAGDVPLKDVFAVGTGEAERDFFAAGLSVSPDFLF